MKKERGTEGGWNGQVPMLCHTSLAPLEQSLVHVSIWNEWKNPQKWGTIEVKVTEREEIWDEKQTNFPTVEGTELWKPAPLFLRLNGQQ